MCAVAAKGMKDSRDKKDSGNKIDAAEFVTVIFYLCLSVVNL
jgi:hypothetical protein